MEDGFLRQFWESFLKFLPVKDYGGGDFLNCGQSAKNIIKTNIQNRLVHIAQGDFLMLLTYKNIPP
jgi:hypothetical protein